VKGIFVRSGVLAQIRRYGRLPPVNAFSARAHFLRAGFRRCCERRARRGGIQGSILLDNPLSKTIYLSANVRRSLAGESIPLFR
jgi:hypothetical protein